MSRGFPWNSSRLLASCSGLDVSPRPYPGRSTSARVQIHGSVWHAAPHRRVRGKEKLGTIVAWMAAERDEWRRRGGDNENKRQKEGWMISVKRKKKKGEEISFSSSSQCDQSDSGGRQRPARLACSGNKAKLRDKRDDRVTHSRRMGKPTAPLTLYSHRGADTETSVLPPLPSCFLLPL